MTASLRPTLHDWGPPVGIDELAVGASAHGQSVGRALVAAPVTWPLQRGAGEVEVAAEMDNEAVRGFHKRCGFGAEALLLRLEHGEH